jgi:hypothetical protein
VRHAMNALFRMSRDTRDPLFPTLVSANQRLLHFRFLAHNFIEALTSYVFDTAIRGHYDAFMAQFEAESQPFSDIFSLAEMYSAVLDDVLSACLLRSSQRLAADLVRGCLELILDFCILCGEMRRGRLKEYNAAPLLEELLGRFRRKFSLLVSKIEMAPFKFE